MAEISLGDAIGSGFGLIRRRPLAVLIWGGLQTAFLLGFFALMAPMYEMMFTQMAGQAATGAPATPNPALLANVMQFQGLSILLQFVGLFVNAVLYCAVFRAVIHPDRNRFASMRLGMTELLVFVLVFGELIIFSIALILIALVIGLVIGLLSTLHVAAITTLVGLALGILVLWGLIYVAVRLSAVGPMMVDDGKVHLLDAWALTKGRAGQMFLMGLCVFVILFVMVIVVEIVIVALFMGVGFTAFSAGGSQAAASLFKQNPAMLLSKLLPVMIFAGVLAVPIYGATLAIMGAPWARAYLDLRHNPAEAF